MTEATPAAESKSPSMKEFYKLFGEVGKLKAQVEAQTMVIDKLCDALADRIILRWGDDTKSLTAKGFILGSLGKNEHGETTADIVTLHHLYSGGIHQQSDVVMGKKIGQWWPMFIPENELKQALENAQDINTEAVTNGTSSTIRRTATISRPGAVAAQ